MKAKSIISNLHLKFAEKTWNDTFQLVQRCMEKPRDESRPCEPLVRALARLHEVFTVSSMNTLRSRLEVIAKQQGMGFHITDATCYLTADLFYLEVVMLPCGGVQEVKVAPHGQSPVPSECLHQLLRLKNFSGFSTKLAGLFIQYNIPGDSEVKLKLFTSLQCLGKDLQQLSHVSSSIHTLGSAKDSDPQMDAVNSGRVGCVIAGKEDHPLTIQFYIAPTDIKKTSGSQIIVTEAVVQTAQVTVGVSDVTHQLQMASVIPQPPQQDPQGNPVFLPLNEVLTEALPACFLLRLQPAIPMTMSFVNKLSQITGMTIPDVDLQWAPLPNLLMRGSLSANSRGDTLNDENSIFMETLPGGMLHSCVLPGAVWEAPEQKRAVIDIIPFTHPAHVPALVDLLRQQCCINTLLSSCITSQHVSPGLDCELHYEVRPESDISFSVTFQQPNTDILAVLLVKVSGSHQITCSLFGAGNSDLSMDEYISTVMKSCVSIPVTLRTLYSKLIEITSVPLSPSCPTTAKTENDHSVPSSTAVTDTSSALTTVSQSAAVPEDSFAASGSSCYALSVAKSELLPEINTSPAVDPYPFTAVGVLSHWMGKNGQLPELI